MGGPSKFFLLPFYFLKCGAVEIPELGSRLQDLTLVASVSECRDQQPVQLMLLSTLLLLALTL